MEAPGAPGIPPTWTSSAKDIVGTALGPTRLWFTLGYGIPNEVYYPRLDIPQIRDLGFIVADGRGFWVEVKRLANYRITPAKTGIPAVTIEHRHDRFTLRLRIAPAPERDVLLIEVDLTGDAALRPYALLAPHLGGTGRGNLAETGRHRGRAVLWAEQKPFGLALAAADAGQRDAWGRLSAGYVGESDGWQDFNRHGAMTWTFDRAGPGNVALMGELPRRAVLALGFGGSKESAATLAFSALCQPFADVWRCHVKTWRDWQDDCRVPKHLPAGLRDEFLTSAMVLHCHLDKTYPGAMAASLSVPWGNSTDSRGGYHIVWPRDLVESAGALLALQAWEEARHVLRYLIATQYEDGHWSQNQWLGGHPYWTGIQLDEVGFPVLLAAALAEANALQGIQVEDMVRRALTFIVSQGPSSQQDRWEEDAGVNSFTLAVCIAALVCGAQFLDEPARSTALDMADAWNVRLEEWTTAAATPLAERFAVGRYYVRIAPAAILEDPAALDRVLPVRNHDQDPRLAAWEQVSLGFLALVRFGLRRADDPVVLDTLKVVDAVLKVDTPHGPGWYRYSADGYGEHADGSPFDGTGQGRLWPLLSGERGHYALAAGQDPLPYLHAMAAMSGPCGLIPEQVWDTTAIPERRLHPGRPTGSAMPLAWAHAEFIKLCASLDLGRPFDRPEAVWRRYGGRRPQVSRYYWLPRAPCPRLPAGHNLRVCLETPATVHWGRDGWRQITDTPTRDGGLGLHVADLPAASLNSGQMLNFTWRRQGNGGWRGADYTVCIIAPP